MLPSVVSIRMSDGSRSQSGSGFFILPNVIATNFHVIEGMASGTVRIVGNTKTYPITGVVGYDKNVDLALIQIAEFVGKPLSLSTSGNPLVGTTIYAVGNPRGLEGTFSPGIVSGIRNFTDGSLIQITAPISSGSSGGPLVNSTAEVVGIAVGGFESGQALNFAIPVSALRGLQDNMKPSVSIKTAGLSIRESPRTNPEGQLTTRPPSISIPDDSQPITSKTAPPADGASERERLLWDEVSKRNAKSDYLFYLNEFPNGGYANEARQRVRNLEEAEENSRWNAAVSGGSLKSYQIYLTEYPTGKFAKEAKVKIEELDRQEQESAWKVAEKRKTEAEYRKYLERWPSGVYASIAKLRLKELPPPSRVSKGRVGETVKNSLGMEFSWIPAGSFFMGSTEAQTREVLRTCIRGPFPCSASAFENERPRRLVTIRSGFWMGRFEVTQGQYESVMGTNPSKFRHCGKDCPVEQVLWKEAKEFIRRLNDQNDGFIYSLPTEAEWEYAARAGTTTHFAFGNSLNSTQANFDGRQYLFGGEFKGPFLEMTRTVGSYKPNAWGLFDMHGNVHEWVEDLLTDGYAKLPNDGSPNTTTGSFRVVRGGSWWDHSYDVRSATRDMGVGSLAINGLDDIRDDKAGFRVVARAK